MYLKVKKLENTGQNIKQTSVEHNQNTFLSNQFSLEDQFLLFYRNFGHERRIDGKSDRHSRGLKFTCLILVCP